MGDSDWFNNCYYSTYYSNQVFGYGEDTTEQVEDEETKPRYNDF